MPNAKAKEQRETLEGLSEVSPLLLLPILIGVL